MALQIIFYVPLNLRVPYWLITTIVTVLLMLACPMYPSLKKSWTGGRPFVNQIMGHTQLSLVPEYTYVIFSYASKISKPAGTSSPGSTHTRPNE